MCDRDPRFLNSSCLSKQITELVADLRNKMHPLVRNQDPQKIQHSWGKRAEGSIEGCQFFLCADGRVPEEKADITVLNCLCRHIQVPQPLLRVAVALRNRESRLGIAPGRGARSHRSSPTESND